ncbi:hypothetical protein OB955_19250 [Halobacteria archaeon AArc-m2/3/4]|uniref:Uncharacterized protein n=1 Tax=Natronoglomus mannanivorans TaxID=2979990 RepID=A0ABT2QIV0_9EURY|nr:hypothetical protein [Halobacteria archaeon AArc-m2/3/4]
MADRCFECNRSLNLVPVDEIVRARESLGFGAANDRMREFCGIPCRARWRGVDPVLEATRQTTIAAWNGTARNDAERIAWCL